MENEFPDLRPSESQPDLGLPRSAGSTPIIDRGRHVHRVQKRRIERIKATRADVAEMDLM